MLLLAVATPTALFISSQSLVPSARSGVAAERAQLAARIRAECDRAVERGKCIRAVTDIHRNHLRADAELAVARQSSVISGAGLLLVTVQILVTVVGTYLLWHQIDLTRAAVTSGAAANREMGAANRIASISTRPWIKFEVRPLSIERVNDLSRITLIAKAVNIGQTPALNVTFRYPKFEGSRGQHHLPHNTDEAFVRQPGEHVQGILPGDHAEFQFFIEVPQQSVEFRQNPMPIFRSFKIGVFYDALGDSDGATVADCYASTTIRFPDYDRVAPNFGPEVFEQTKVTYVRVS